MFNPALMTLFSEAKPKPSQLLQGAAALLALGSSDRDEIRVALARVKSLGGVLEQVGALALSADRPWVGQVLAQEFGIYPEHYQSVGGEPLLRPLPGTPYVLTLCVVRDTARLQRAIDWGLDANARFTVDEMPGAFVQKRSTHSLMSRVIAGCNSQALEQLMAKADPPTIDEQHSRMRALWEGIQRASTGGGYEKDAGWRVHCKAMIDLLGPGGNYAMAQSFWDVEADPRQAPLSMGEAMALEISQDNPTFTPSMMRALILPWLCETMTAANALSMARAHLNLSVKTRTQFALPAWCVDKLAEADVPTLLEEAFVGVVRCVLREAKERGNNDSSYDASRSATDCLGHLKHLIKRAGGNGLQHSLSKTLPLLAEEEFMLIGRYMAQGLCEAWWSVAGKSSQQEPALVEWHRLLKELSNTDLTRSGQQKARDDLVAWHAREVLGRTTQASHGPKASRRL